MAINLRKVAQKATTLAEIMQGKEKGDTSELINRGSVTINDCEVTEIPNELGEKERVWCFTIKEEPKKFFFAGTMVKSIFEEILVECEGDYEVMYNAVNDQGLDVRFKNGKTKKGKQITLVEVL